MTSLCSTSAAGKDLSNGTQIRVISSNFPAITSGYSMVKITHLDDALSEFFKLEASPVEGQSLHCSRKKRKGEKGKAKNQNLNIEKRKDVVGHFLLQNSPFWTLPASRFSHCCFLSSPTPD